MMTINELKAELFEELYCKDNIAKLSNHKGKYVNEIFSESSSILSSLLAESLCDYKDWENQYWVDDILITRLINSNNDIIEIWGIVIFGNTINDLEWVSPIHVKISNQTINFNFFDDNSNKLITYEQFNMERDIFDNYFYETKDRNPANITWKYQSSI